MIAEAKRLGKKIIKYKIKFAYINYFTYLCALFRKNG